VDDVLPRSRLSSSGLELAIECQLPYATEGVLETSQPQAQVSTPRVSGPTSEIGKTPIWKHFHKSNTEPSKAICNYCSINISIKSGSTSSLQRHLIAKHKKNLNFL